MDIQANDIFFIDTSSVFFSCGYDYKGRSDQTFSKLDTSHSMGFEKRIEEFLKKGDISLNDFPEFSYNAGPGSFTGLRIGASFISAFAFAGNRTLSYFRISDILKCSLKRDQVYIRNSKKTEFYVFPYGNDDFEIMPMGPFIEMYKGHDILYDGNIDHSDHFEYREYNLKPSDFLENAEKRINVENNVIKLYYMNNPDIR